MVYTMTGLLLLSIGLGLLSNTRATNLGPRCNGIVTAINSSSYLRIDTPLTDDGKYANHVDCSFVLKIPPNALVIWEIESLRTRANSSICKKDFIEYTVDGNIMPRLCGNYGNNTIEIDPKDESYELRIRFRTNWKFRSTGLKSLLTVVEVAQAEVTATEFSTTEESTEDPWPSTEDPCPSTPTAGCGIRLPFVGKISNGEEVAPNSIPWQVALTHEPHGSIFCSGVLISETEVLTSGSCVYLLGLFDMTVYAHTGEHLEANPVDGTPIQVTCITIHPNFNEGPTNNNNVALLTLERPVEFNHMVNSICLPELDESFEGQQATVSGWGIQEFGNAPNHLRAANVTINTKAECKSVYNDSFDSSMVCAHGDNDEDHCFFDEGGPLSVKTCEKREVLAGIISHRNGGHCGTSDQPGIYANVAALVNWIKNNKAACMDSCGVVLQSVGRIKGGSEVTNFSIPWQAALTIETDGSYFCGGTVIGPRHILTAGHCISLALDANGHLKVPLIVAVEEQIEGYPNDGEFFNVDCAFLHPNFSITGDGSNQIRYDFGIVKLDRAIVFNKRVNRVCLPKNPHEDYAMEMLTVSGWGTLDDGGPVTSVLHAANITSYSNEECVSEATVYNVTDITNEMICAGSFNNSGVDACDGDNGGPLTHKAANGVSTLVGVVSWSRGGCGAPNTPRVYGRVTSVLDWIEETVAKPCPGQFQDCNSDCAIWAKFGLCEDVDPYYRECCTVACM